MLLTATKATAAPNSRRLTFMPVLKNPTKAYSHKAIVGATFEAVADSPLAVLLVVDDKDFILPAAVYAINFSRMGRSANG